MQLMPSALSTAESETALTREFLGQRTTRRLTRLRLEMQENMVVVRCMYDVAASEICKLAKYNEDWIEH